MVHRQYWKVPRPKMAWKSNELLSTNHTYVIFYTADKEMIPFLILTRVLLVMPLDY